MSLGIICPPGADLPSPRPEQWLVQTPNNSACPIACDTQDRIALLELVHPFTSVVYWLGRYRLPRLLAGLIPLLERSLLTVPPRIDQQSAGETRASAYTGA